MITVDLLPAFGEVPLDSLSIDEARGMKLRGEAYFVNHGKQLRLKPTVQEETDRRDQKGSMEQWRTVHSSELCAEQKKIMGSRFLRVTTFQYNPA